MLQSSEAEKNELIKVKRLWPIYRKLYKEGFSLGRVVLALPIVVFIVSVSGLYIYWVSTNSTEIKAIQLFGVYIASGFIGWYVRKRLVSVYVRKNT